MQLLKKGLSYSPTPTQHSTEAQLDILKKFDEYSKSIRPYNQKQSNNTQAVPTNTDTQSSLVFRKMKFLPKPSHNSYTAQYSGIRELEDYIFNTKDLLDTHLSQICSPDTDNITPKERKAITQVQHSRHSITIKPADKNLGVVVLDTDDYIAQCASLLKNQEVYRLAESYPRSIIQTSVENILIQFKEELKHINPRLYTYLLPPKHSKETPKFYGLPKVHKEYIKLPPMRPIISQSCSPLMPSARFIDHVLQPLAQSYTDYLKNSTSLILQLKDMYIPEDAVLVTVDVKDLYPSIPQTECLRIIYQEMLERRYLILADTNLIIKLLHANINFNYFQFATLCFQQIRGTAMGTCFSPTIANIFMSVIIRKFLKTQPVQPLLLRRYIDDVLIIWPHKENLNQFLTELNDHHPNLKFTHCVSESTVNFLDLTI